jgi:HlyD family secretion protein
MPMVSPRAPAAADLPPQGRAAAPTPVAPTSVAPAPVQTSEATVAHAPPAAPSHARRTHWVVIGIVVVIVAGTIWWAVRPKAVAVQIARVTRAAMRVTVDADARTRVRTHFSIAAPVAGLVERIALREGDSVRTGQIVAVISTPPTHPTDQRISAARLEVAKAERADAEARAAQAATALTQGVRDSTRTHRLVDAGAIADREQEVANVALANLRSAYESARAQIAVATANLAGASAAERAAAGNASTVVRSPGSGRILRVPEQSERVVTAGAPLLEIGDPRSLEVAADVLSSDAAIIRAGQEVELYGWGGAPLRGVVSRVEPSARTRVSALGVEEQRLTVVIGLEDAPPNLGDGYRLDASTVVWSGTHVLTVPASALLRTDRGWEVYRVEQGRARRILARVGHLGGGVAEVLGGLLAGDSVILFPPDGLRSGARVHATP